jgi:hypothetical protein
MTFHIVVDLYSLVMDAVLGVRFQVDAVGMYSASRYWSLAGFTFEAYRELREPG